MAARFSTRLTLEEQSREPDGAGGVLATWVERGAIWAELKAGSGRERAVGLKPTSTVTHRACIRYAAPGAADRPRPDQRLTDGTRFFAILAVAEADDRRRELSLWLEEGALS